MNPNITFAPRPGARPGVPLRTVLMVAALGATAIAFGAIIGGCSPQAADTVTAAAQNVPAPGIAATATIRTRVAAVVQREVAAHPATAPWVNGLAQASFEVSDAKLPDPAVLRSLFGAVSVFAPADIASPIKAVLDVYTQDYVAAAAVQGGSRAYLTALGQGIQDGVAAAKAATNGGKTL